MASAEKDTEVEIMNDEEQSQDEFKFSGEILWTKCFVVDRKNKEIECKTCRKKLKFTGSLPSTTTENRHLNGKTFKKCLENTLALMPNESGPWNKEKYDLMRLLF